MRTRPPLVEAVCDSLVNENRVAIIMRTAATGTAGAYVDVARTFRTRMLRRSGIQFFTEDDLEPGIEFVAGGTLGTSGITYRYRTGGSLSSTLSGVQALERQRISNSHTAPGSTFLPPRSASRGLGQRASNGSHRPLRLDIRQRPRCRRQHSGSGIGSAATDIATAIVLANQLRTAYEAHRVLTSGGVHGACRLVERHFDGGGNHVVWRGRVGQRNQGRLQRPPRFDLRWRPRWIG